MRATLLSVVVEEQRLGAGARLCERHHLAGEHQQLMVGQDRAECFVGTNHGTSVSPLPTTVGPDRLTLILSEDSYRGDAKFIAKIDGRQIGGTTVTVLTLERETPDVGLPCSSAHRERVAIRQRSSTPWNRSFHRSTTSAARRVPAVRQADRAPPASFVMVSRIGGGGRKSAIKSPPAPHYRIFP